MGASVTDGAIPFAIPRLRGSDALSSAESTDEIHSAHERAALVLGAPVREAAIVGYFLYLLGDGMTW